MQLSKIKVSRVNSISHVGQPIQSMYAQVGFSGRVAFGTTVNFFPLIFSALEGSKEGVLCCLKQRRRSEKKQTKQTAGPLPSKLYCHSPPVHTLPNAISPLEAARFREQHFCLGNWPLTKTLRRKGDISWFPKVFAFKTLYLSKSLELQASDGFAAPVQPSDAFAFSPHFWLDFVTDFTSGQLHRILLNRLT